MINLTKEQAIELLQGLAVLEGFSWAHDDTKTSLIFERYLDPIIKILTDKLIEANDDS